MQAIARVADLRKLTLHGNPIEENRHYRNYILYSCHDIQQLDFSRVTKQQLANVASWAQTFRKKLKMREEQKEALA